MTGWRQRARDLAAELDTLYVACRDPRVPWFVKLLAAAVVGYALSPIDLIPDWIPFVGVLDDLVIVPLGVLLVRRLIPADVLADCRQRAQGQMERARRAGRIAMAVILTAWVGFVVVGLWFLARWLHGWMTPGAAF